MDLFGQLNGTPHNLLPYDGAVHYYGPIFSRQASDVYFDTLMNTVKWENDHAVIFGKIITTKRKVAWCADTPFSYTYSGITKTASPWFPALLELKKHVEKTSGETFNSCLLNLYHDGDEGMGWHCDEETDLLPDGAIGSLSLGAERNFSFKHKKSKQRISQFLEHGALLIMKGTTQTHWLHRLPTTKKVHHPRINLTFRTINNA
jgi:alkylated DNA repair dioxygenase AlkB